MRRRRHNDPLSLVTALKGLPRVTCFNPEKVKYRSLKAAETSAEKQWLRDRKILYPYYCGDHYHLTSKKPGTNNGDRSHRASA
jgi:hypothetical protein